MPGVDPAGQQTWENFLEAALRVNGALNRALVEAHGLTLQDVRMLAILSSSETGSARMGDLADQLLALPSGVTRQVRRLEQAGLVRREASPEDGRGVHAYITNYGSEVVAAAFLTYSEVVQQRFLSPLNRGQMSKLGITCQRISDALKTVPGGKGHQRSQLRSAVPSA
ncbi:MAG: MarR family transcriptional regulator [Mycobacterium sp.]|nr:MarR family transcriptional regulator [Mycobacterium sp.]